MKKNRRLVPIFESNIKGKDLNYLIIILLLNPYFNIYIYIYICMYVCMYVCMYMDILHFRSISVNFIKSHSILQFLQFWEK